MGWDGIYKRYCSSPMDYLVKQYTYETNIDPGLRKSDTTVRCSVVERSKKGFNYFFIIKIDKFDGSTKYAVIVALVRIDKHMYYFKTMSEVDGPYAYAHASFIDKVEKYIPAPPNMHALQWRLNSRLVDDRDRKLASIKREWKSALSKGDILECYRLNALWQEENKKPLS